MSVTDRPTVDTSNIDYLDKKNRINNLNKNYFGLY